MAKQMNVFVNIGARLDSTFAGAIAQAEGRFGRFARVIQRNAAVMREAMRGIGSAAKEVGKLAAAGAGLHGAADAFKHALKSGAELQSVKVDMAKAGIGKAEIQSMWDQSLKLAVQYKNVTASSLLELGKEIRSVLTHPDEVAHVLPSLAAAKSLLDARDPTGGASAGLNMLVKGAEAIGAAQNPERFIHLVDGYVKAMQVMGKTISPESIYEFNKYSKLAGANLSDRFLLTTAQSLGQELGGSTAGLGIGGLYKQIAGGMQNQHTAAKEFARVGLINRSALDYTKTGEIKGVKPGARHAVKGDTLAATDPDKWVYGIVLPAIEKVGIRSMQDQLAWVRKAFPNGNVADVIGKMIVQRHAFEAHAQQYDSASGLSGTSMNRDNPTTALDGLTKSLETFASALTDPVMKDAGHALDAVSAWIGSLSLRLDAFNKAHPTLAKAEAPIAGGVAVAGAAGAGGLLWKMLTGGFGLKGSALALDRSAAALTAAAARLTLAGGKPWSAPSVVEAAAPAASIGLGGAAVAAGAAAGATLDWNFGGNTGALGLITGQESDHQKTMRYLRERDESRAAAARAGLPSTWGTGKAKALPGGAAPGKGYVSSFEIDGSALHDFLWGKAKQSMSLPGFGGKTPLRLPDGASDRLKDQAGKAGTAAGENAADGIGAALTSKVGEIAAAAKGVFDKVQSIFSGGINLPVRAAPSVSGAPAIVGARARGGSVLSGKTYLVGEHGPELFRAAGSGRIETNRTLNNLAERMNGPKPQPGGGGKSWYDAVMRAEGTSGRDPYNTVLGYGRYGSPSKPLTDMSLGEAYQFGRIVRARHGSSSALGAFQIVGRTMKDAMKATGLGWGDKFSPENQRSMADWIRRKQGFGAWEGFKRHPGELAAARAGSSVVDPTEGPASRSSSAAVGKIIRDAQEGAARHAAANGSVGTNGAGDNLASRVAAIADRAQAAASSAQTRSKSTSKTPGGIVINLTVNSTGGDGNEVARTVRRELQTLIAQMEREQSHGLHD